MLDAGREPPASETDVIRFGERVIGLLDAASYSTTYKFALLIALIDCCMELSDPPGEPESRIHPRRLAEKVVSLYWRHTNPFGADGNASPLRQSNSGQAEIVTIIVKYRLSDLLPPGSSTTEARFCDPEGFARLVSSIEWTLVEMPLPRLQRVGNGSLSFLYKIDWDETVRQKDYRSSGFDQEVHLKPDVARQFVRLAGILRPLI